jgi:ATP-binding cassette subfamily F protein uup
MNLISVENIAKSYGERILFSDISFGINKDQKIALIAENGTGKTSILNIIAGKDSPDKGQVNYRKGTRISYLPQDPDLSPDLTIEETIFASDNEVLQVILNYEKALAHPEDEKKYQKAFEAMERFAAWDFETQYKQILFKLQLPDLHAKIGSLSGGQKKRVALANALINQPEVLILDEPTNHLDLEMIEWLESYFAKENITLFMVTHDRYFLERVCNEIIELDNQQLYSYKGNYSYYLEKKEARQEMEALEQHKTGLLFKKELDWMRRQPKARTTKSKSRIDDFYEIKNKALQRRKDHVIQLEINMERLGSKILELHNVSKSFPDKPILSKFNYSFLKGERIGIIGKNGTGKTTFLNLITGLETPDSGKITVGETIKFGYYTQNGIPLKPGQKVIDVPTNDLDVVTLNVLESFLLDFPGCLVVVSHDRYFMDKIVDHLFIFRGDNIVEDFPGNYSDFRIYEDSLLKDSRAAKELKDKKVPDGNTWRADGKNNKLSYSEQKEYGQLEKEIKKLERQKEDIQLQFSNAALSGEEIDRLSISLKELIDAIDTKTERWFELSAILER